MKRLKIIILFVSISCLASCAVSFDAPFERTGSGHYVLSVETPTGKRRFLFDTGCGITMVSERLAADLGADGCATLKATDFDGHTAEMACVRVRRMMFGRFHAKNLPVAVLPDSSYVVRCLGLDGIVGSDWIAGGAAVMISNRDSVLRFSTAAKRLGDLAEFGSCPMELVRNCPSIEVEDRDGERSITRRVVIDTGTKGYYANSLHFSAIAEAGILARDEEAYGYGNIGFYNRRSLLRQRRGIVPELRVCGAIIRHAPVRTTGGDISLLGNGLFDYGCGVIDYAGGRFYFRPHEAFIEAGADDALNLTIIPSGEELIVGAVWDAALASFIRPGDRVLAVDRHPAAALAPCGILTEPLRAGSVVEIETASGRMQVEIRNVYNSN